MSNLYKTEDLQVLCGKTISAVEYVGLTLTITFTDKSVLSIEMHEEIEWSEVTMESAELEIRYEEGNQ